MASLPTTPGPADSVFATWLKRCVEHDSEPFDSLLRSNPEHAPALLALHEHWLHVELALRLAKLGPGAHESFADRLRAAHGSGVDSSVSLDGPSADLGKASSDLLRRLSQKSTGTRYRLEGEVARGGMGAILRVWDEDIRRHLAMKVVLGRGEASTDGATPVVVPAQVSRFLEEAQITGQLDHPGIVPVHELGLDQDGRVFFTMKLVKGRDLKSIYDLVFEGRDGWNETRALSVILKVCEAVAYAHKKGVIHRDLKPANVMVGDFGEVYVMDWGLARVIGRKDQHDLRLAPEGNASKSVRTERRVEREETPDSPIVTMDGTVVGTPAYMSPEQARGEVETLDARADVYAIGAMLYHLLARQVPFVNPGEHISGRTVLARLLDGPPKAIRALRVGVPVELEAMCERAMQRDSAKRYAGTVALSDDLRAYLERRVVRAYETGTWAEARKWVKRNRALTASLLIAVAALLGLLVVVNANRVQTGLLLALADGRRALAERGAAKLLHALTREQEARRESELLGERLTEANRAVLDAAPMLLFKDGIPEDKLTGALTVLAPFLSGLDNDLGGKAQTRLDELRSRPEAQGRGDLLEQVQMQQSRYRAAKQKLDEVQAEYERAVRHIKCQHCAGRGAISSVAGNRNCEACDGVGKVTTTR